MFRLTVTELLKIQTFWKWKFNKIETNILRKLGQTLGIVGKLLMSWISWSDFANFRHKERDILNFEQILSLKINSNEKKKSHN